MRGFLLVPSVSRPMFSRSLRNLSIPVLAVLWLWIALALTLPAGFASANVLPEAAILVHVEPYSPPNGSCDTPLTSCDQMERSTTESGLMLFQIYVYPLAYLEDHDPIHSLDLNLTWPESWQLSSYDACANGSAVLTQAGAVHTLNLVWPQCPQMTGNVFLAARLVLDVDRYGKLDFANYDPVPLGLGCPPHAFVAEAVGFFAEAGVQCDFTRGDCVREVSCIPEFNQTELVLTAPERGSVQGELPFTAMSAWGPAPPCPLEVTASDPWVTASVQELEWPNWRLAVTADASQLSPGTYDTSIQVSAFGIVGRCVHVNLEVTSTVGISNDTPSEPHEVLSWGKIKSGYR